MVRPADWTPAVLVTASVSLTVTLGVLLASPGILSPFESRPGPGIARRRLDAQVDVWVGPAASGLTAVLRPVWGQADCDRDHDRRLNEGLGLGAVPAPAWYQLLLFNTGTEERTFALADGGLLLTPDDGSVPARLLALGPRRARGEIVPRPGLDVVLSARGTFEDAVVVPPGTMVDLLVAFDRRLELGAVGEVASAGGAAFHRRRMPRKDLEGLVEDPDAALVGSL